MIRGGLQVRLTAILILTILLLTTAMVVTINLVTVNRYKILVRNADLRRAEGLTDFFASYYRNTGSWSGLDNLLHREMPQKGMGRMRNTPLHWAAEPLLRIIVTDRKGRIVAATAGMSPAGPPALPGTKTGRKLSSGKEITVDGETVGYLFVGSMIGKDLAPEDSLFLRTITFSVILVGVLSAFIALAAGTLTLTKLTEPLLKLIEASEKVTRGDLDVRVPESQKDEIGHLGYRFNSMLDALKLSRSQQKRIIADSAHELRTPISLIQGTLEMMLEGIYPMDRSRIKTLHEESVRLGNLVSELGALAKADENNFFMHFIRIDIKELLNFIIENFDPAAKRLGVDIQAAIKPDTVIKGDKEQLIRLFSNLLSNALRYAPEGSAVFISCEEHSGKVFISVTDQGPGVPGEEHHLVFQRFYRVEKSRNRDLGGTGLGLAISREIAERHGGELYIDPEYSDGARFILVLPQLLPI
ncbi:MAG: ATP-binding protein [Spirochaetia bacterium]